MLVENFIEKFPSLKRSQDYEFLRKKGIEYIQKLSSEIWTDHNIHDPGITMLEIVSYAISDLGYKTDFAIEDILAEKSLYDDKKVWEESQDTFYSPREILPCNPVTLNDFRKVMIDVPQVRGAWLHMQEKSLPPIFYDKKINKLVDIETAYSRRINIQGLYKASILLEDDSLLGDLNNWKMTFDVTNDEEEVVGELDIFIKPVWNLFFEENLNPYDFENYWEKPLSSIIDTDLYEGVIVFEDDGLQVEIPFNLKSPFPKTDSNKLRVRQELNANLFAISEFIKERIFTCSKVGRKVEKRLHETRNLCEDFIGIEHTEVEDIGVCTDIEIESDADVDRVLAEIQFALENFFTPPLPFFSLEEMLENGDCLEDIFLGPALKHGFLKEKDLKATELVEEIHVSDILQILMDIDGIKAVKKIQLNKSYLGLILKEGVNWCLHVTPGRAVKFNVATSKIVFYKNLIPFKANERSAEFYLEELKAIQSRARLKPDDYDIIPEEGQNRNLSTYHSIQEDFPLVYGIGREGLAPSVPDLRKAQAKQLKAFLTLIDQILSNYCAQLGNIKNLFSLDPDIRRTYFSQLLVSLPETYQITEKVLFNLGQNGWTSEEIEGLVDLVDLQGMDLDEFDSQIKSRLPNATYDSKKEELIELAKIPEIKVPDLPNAATLVRGFVGRHLNDSSIEWDMSKTYKDEWNEYLLEVKQMYWDHYCDIDPFVEDQTTYEGRKNRILDHLMARFSEQFTDYVLLISNIDGPKAAGELIEDKISFLKDYPILSRNRGKGFNYKLFGDIENVSGTEIRTSRLLGVEDWRRKRIVPQLATIFEVYEEDDDDGILEYRFRLRDDDNKILLSAVRRYLSDDDLKEELEKCLSFGIEKKNYKLRYKSEKFSFYLEDNSGRKIAAHRKFYTSKYEAELKIDECIRYLEYQDWRKEGFHLVEHMLLRPITYGNKLFKISPEIDESPGFIDPYSFRVTAVVPYWPERYQDMDFRRFFEKTLREEIPAHIHVKICWVDEEDMKRFEDLFFKWLELKALPLHEVLDGDPEDDDYFLNVQKNLISTLESFNSIYPEARLHDCDSEGDENIILLNHAKLGSNKGN